MHLIVMYLVLSDCIDCSIPRYTIINSMDEIAGDDMSLAKEFIQVYKES